MIVNQKLAVDLEHSNVTLLSDLHSVRYDNVIFDDPLELSAMYISQFYNCYFLGGLHVHNQANDITFYNCGFGLKPVVIEDACAVNIIGGNIEGIAGIGLTINNSNMVSVRGTYFENDNLGHILVNSRFLSSIHISDCFFNSANFKVNCVRSTGGVRPVVENCYFMGTQLKMLDYSCITKNNRFSTMAQYVANP